MANFLGLDTGGTFTDAVLFNEQGGVVAAAKSLTTKYDLAIGLSGAVDRVLSECHADETLEIGLVSISTTLATNAIVEGQGAPVCLVLIGQNPDALTRADLGRAIGDDPVVFVDGGHGALGDEQYALDLEAARAAILRHAPKVAAFAVAGLFAVRNPAHELAVRDLIRELTGLPVTCTHELTSNLDAPRRALTAVLNARLVPLIQELVFAVRGMLAERHINAPLMVVKGDGSLVSADAALKAPVETILSGPAASVVGARYLAKEQNAAIVDIGGTTTDTAMLRDGWPSLNLAGATVGGWRTMVEAVSVHTVGIGGDSELRFDDDGGLVVGPRRTMPLSLLVHHCPDTLDTLRAQVSRGWGKHYDGRFALRLRPLDSHRASLSSGEAWIWDTLANGPTSLEELSQRPLERLVKRGLAAIAAFTPSDAAHVLQFYDAWSVEAAELGAVLWTRRESPRGQSFGDDVESFCRRVIEQVIVQSSEALVAAALAEERGVTAPASDDRVRVFLDKAFSRQREVVDPLLGVSLTLKRPIVAIGAPAATYYPAIAERLGTRLSIPPFAAVSNALGAVASGVMQRVTAQITAPDAGRYRVHLASGVRDFSDLENAADYAERESTRLAEQQATGVGAADVRITTQRADQVVTASDGLKMFIESRITAVAVGRPRLAPAQSMQTGVTI